MWRSNSALASVSSGLISIINAPACRANDTTDIHIIRGSKYAAQPSLPFRTATLDHIQCGHLDCTPAERQPTFTAVPGHGDI